MGDAALLSSTTSCHDTLDDVSGYTDDIIALYGGLDSDVAFLQKPFTAVDLACKVREVLDAPCETA
jgi:hypothetical protein